MAIFAFIHSKVCKLICEILLTLPTTLTLSRRSVITEIFSKARKIVSVNSGAAVEKGTGHSWKR